MTLPKTKEMKVHCPKCGEEFEVDVPVVEVTGYAPSGQILLHEETYPQLSPEAVKIWEKRKKQIE